MFDYVLLPPGAGRWAARFPSAFPAVSAVLTDLIVVVVSVTSFSPQVMALIAYLMEHKNNFGPHLIIVPNAVIVNWKSELQQVWLCVCCGHSAAALLSRS